MLSPADAALVQRDPHLPGLALLLDPAAMLETLQRQVEPVQIEAMQPTYLRYKPGTSCLAAYRVCAGGAVVNIYAKAYRAGDTAKLGKAQQHQAGGFLGFGVALLENAGVAIYDFPNDRGLAGLKKLNRPDSRHRLLTKALPRQPELWAAAVHGLRYKPERRYVAQLVTEAGPQAVLKFYTPAGYEVAARNSRALASLKEIGLAPALGRSSRAAVLAHSWLDGQSLDEAIRTGGVETGQFEAVGAALARLHHHRLTELTYRGRSDEVNAWLAAAGSVAAVCPPLAEQAKRLARRLGTILQDAPLQIQTIHGDFSSDQVMLTSTGPAFLDFDRAGLGDPAADIGSFIAHLESRVLAGALSPIWVSNLIETFITGYRQVGQGHLPPRLNLYLSAGLLQLAPQPFRHRAANWPEQTQALLQRAEEILNNGSFDLEQIDNLRPVCI